VDEFYRESDALRTEYASAKLKGEPPSALSTKHYRAEKLRDLMSDLRKLNEGVKDRDKRWEVEKYLTGLSRMGLGEQKLERYPTPFENDVPEAVREVVSKHLATIAATVARPEHLKTDKKATSLSAQAVDYLKHLGVSGDDLTIALVGQLRKSGRKSDSIREWNGRLRSRL
jgi:hypothetical protein